jgi:hypothetical protein
MIETIFYSWQKFFEATWIILQFVKTFNMQTIRNFLISLIR